MIQSGTYNGTLHPRRARRYEVNDWWGQRDHSWGIRDHARCPLWMWLAIQFPEGMVAVWHWEYPNGARVYTDGCFAPADGSDPIPVVDFRHDLHWIDGERQDGRLRTRRRGRHRRGRPRRRHARGRHACSTSTPRAAGPSATARSAAGSTRSWSAPSDGWEGTAIYEVTGAHHHHFFPVPRAENLPPDGL